MRPVLFFLAQSPWSEKARWALDHHNMNPDMERFLKMGNYVRLFLFV